MLSKLRLTLRQKIVVYCLIVLSPVVVLAYFLVDENSSYVRQQSLDRINSQANLAQLAIDGLLDTWVGFLDNLAQTPAIRSRDIAASQGMLSAVFPLYSDFVTSLASIDEAGRIVVGVQKEGVPTHSVADRAYFREVMRTGKPVVSGRLIGRSTDQPVFAIAAPVKDGTGRAVGAVAAGVSLRQIRELLQRIGEGAGDTIVVDSDGMVLSHPDRQYVDTETSLKSLDPVDLALKGGQGTVEHEDPLDGSNWFWAYRPLSRVPWAVVAKYPVGAAKAPVYTSLLKWSFFLVGAIALALALASLSAERLIRPLRRLTRRMAVVAPEANVKAPAQTNMDELHELTQVFNGICATLAQTSAELAGVKEELAARAKTLEMMAHKALEARDEERRRISMNIHDGVLQLIGAAQIEAKLVRRTGALPDVQSKRLGQVESVLGRALVELRGLARELCPPDLAEFGLVFAVYNHLIILRETYNIPRVALFVSGEDRRFQPETENAAFRIVQEGLANAAKHAEAQAIEVFVSFESERLRLVVVDNGKGFNLKDVDGKLGDRYGLANMRERAAGVCGACSILSMPAGGTRVEVELPIEGGSCATAA